MNSDFYQLLIRSLPLLLKGAQMTLYIALLAGCVSGAVGILFGILSCRHYEIPLLSKLVKGITFLYRAVPFYVQLLIVYFVLPDLFGWNLEPFPTAIIALGLCSSGYTAQIVRGGLDALPASQWEAAFALGYSRTQTLRHIALPQVGKATFPTLTNELESLLKSTSIVSSIGLLELTRAGMNLVSREMQPVPIYLLIALFYLCLSALLGSCAKLLEKRFSYATR